MGIRATEDGPPSRGSSPPLSPPLGAEVAAVAAAPGRLPVSTAWPARPDAPEAQKTPRGQSEEQSSAAGEDPARAALALSPRTPLSSEPLKPELAASLLIPAFEEDEELIAWSQGLCLDDLALAEDPLLELAVPL